ncbi:ytfP [Cucurbita argyrosperma subsp. argyrosperma]|nr:ytfP [Cucurbita argyrosperma subsp. argyrosperma]
MNLTKAVTSIVAVQKLNEELLVVVGGGAAGVYGAVRAKTLAPNLNVMVIEKGRPLSKVKISGGGRCNVTNGHFTDAKSLAEHYPRGHKEFRGPFFNVHGPIDTMSWFSNHGVQLKVEDDGRVFPVTNSSASIVDCLMSEAKRTGVSLQTGKVVTSASISSGGKFALKIQKLMNSVEHVEANYLLIASGSSRQGFSLAAQLGHSLIDPVPSLFTFKIEDPQLAELSGVGPMLVTHWGLSGPVILRLSAWGARDLFASDYKGFLNSLKLILFYVGLLIVDFAPDWHLEDVKTILSRHKSQFMKQKVHSSCPSEFGLVKRFWKYLLDREEINDEILWASISNKSLASISSLLKQCIFKVLGKVHVLAFPCSKMVYSSSFTDFISSLFMKGQFKDEFVTAGGVQLSEVLFYSSLKNRTRKGNTSNSQLFLFISLKTMESKIHSRLFFAGEVLNVDGVTGGFNFQNAWSGGYIAGTSIGKLANGEFLGRDISNLA